MIQYLGNIHMINNKEKQGRINTKFRLGGTRRDMDRVGTQGLQHKLGVGYTVCSHYYFSYFI